LWTTTLILMGTTATGCVAEPSITELDLPEQNIEQWTLPLDAYMPPWDDVTRSDYARNIVMAECLNERGYDVEPPWRDVNNSTRRAHINPVGRQLFTEELASEHAYGRATNTFENIEEQQVYSEGLNNVDDSTWTSCVQVENERLPLIQNVGFEATELAAQASSQAVQDAAVIEARDTWRECMLDVGLPDLPRTPEEMPPASLGDARDGAVDDIADPREIEVATQDFTCRVSSGYRDALYEVEWDLQVDSLRDNIVELELARSTLESNRDVVNEALGLTSDEQG